MRDFEIVSELQMRRKLANNSRGGGQRVRRVENDFDILCERETSIQNHLRATEYSPHRSRHPLPPPRPRRRLPLQLLVCGRFEGVSRGSKIAEPRQAYVVPF